MCVLAASLCSNPLFAQGGSAQAPAAGSAESPLRRWLDVQAAALYLRYRVIESSEGVVTTNQLQYRETFRARVKFDPEGRYSLNLGLFSGPVFTSSWNLTGAGTGEPTAKVFLKQLYGSALPVKTLELQAGGLYVVRGESTEITTYDDDGYLVGGRVSVRDPRHLFVNEITGTIGNLGAIEEPNVFKRFDDLDDLNYKQILVSKRVSKAIGTSVDYTDVDGAGTLRGAIAVTERAPLHLDSIRLELYRRVNDQEGGGLAITADRAVTRRLRLGGGYANIDEHYGELNADRFVRGERFFATSNLALTRDLSVSCFFTRAFHNDFPVPNRTRFDTVLAYNVLNPLRRGGLLSRRPSLLHR